ncbi:cytochrome P450 [Microtetraspora sp. NBRC 13810]|uniref:cytochrome P450 n=1 Tax=Microtetraspora sp. NBRC 13810 TaxID=3030990 RepID=UPI0024A2521B|nr:cytochrome P450 [Microtetraspora sp. NBRC 13810]GLW08511.1 cytochrome P450 [Microtetraspora sp. NBRC 13810]
MSARPGVPQAPGGWPGIGHAIPLLRRRLEFFTSLAALGDVVEVRLGPTPAYVVTHPELVHRVLVTHARDYARGRFFDRLTSLIGEGLATTSGQTHRRLRRMVQPAFHHSRFTAYAEVMREAAETMTASWRPGQTIAVDRAVNDLSLRVVAKTLFASEVGEQAAARIERSMPIVMHGVLLRTILPTVWGRLPTPGNRRYDRAIAEITRAVGETIDAYRGGGVDHGDVMSMLLAARDEGGRPLSDEQLRDQVLTLFIAGAETTGAELAWALWELGRRPDVEQRVHAELEAVLGDKPPAWEHLPSLDYTARVIAESLRLHSSWLIMRRTLRETSLGGVTLPKGAEVIYSPYMLHHDPRWFPDPLRFDPDRWLPGIDGGAPKWAHIPFGSGAHKCIGDSFASAEMLIAMAVICSRWRLRPDPARAPKEVATVTVRPDRLPMTAELRVPAPSRAR